LKKKLESGLDKNQVLHKRSSSGRIRMQTKSSVKRGLSRATKKRGENFAIRSL